MPGPILAHSWGWDEVLYFAVPVIAALLWVRWIERRAAARKAAAAHDGEVAAAEDGRSARADGGDGPAANMTGPEQP